MATPVGQLTIEMAANIVRLQKDMDAARKTVDGAMASIEKSVNTAMQTVGTLFAGVSIANFAGKLVNVQREFDVLNSSLITVTGSTAAAAKEFEWIQKFAATTPFSLAEVTQAFVKMKALGLDASREALISYGNTASAMGKSLNQMIEAVADASTGEFERLKEFGIKAKSEGDRVTLTFRGISTNIGKNAAEIEAYLRRIGDVDFAGAMETRAKTLDGAISNLGDSWDQLFKVINDELTGDVLLRTVKSTESAIQGLSGVVKTFAAIIEQNQYAIMAWGAVFLTPALVSGITAVIGAFGALRIAVLGVTAAFAANPIALAILAITAAAVPAVSAINNYMKANDAAAKEQEKLNESQAETERLLRQAKPVIDQTKKATDSLTGSNSANTKELEKQAQAYQKLINDIEEKNALMLAELNGQEKLTNGQQYALKVMMDLQAGTLKLNDAQKIRLTQTLEEMLRTEQMIETKKKEIAAAKEANDEFDRYFDSIEKARQAQEDAIKSARETVEQLEFETKTLTMSNTERQIAIELRKLEKDGLDQNSEAYRVMAERIRKAVVNKDAVEQNIEQQKKLKDEYEKTSEAIEKSLTDALMRGFESGKDFGKNLADTLVNMFKTLILRPIIQPIAQGASSLITGALGFGSAGSAMAGGGAGADTGILGSILGGFGAFGSYAATGFMSSVTGVGLGTSLGAGAAIMESGSVMAGLGMSIGAVVPYIAAFAAAASILSNALGGDTSVTGGGLIGRMGAATNSIKKFTEYTEDGGWFHSDDVYNTFDQLGSEMQNFLDQASETIYRTTRTYAEAIGLSSEAIDNFTQEIFVDLTGLNAEQQQAKIAEVINSFQEAMTAQFAGALEPLRLAGETFTQTLARLAAIQDASFYLNEFGGAFTNFATSTITARQNIIDLAGGIDQLIQKSQGFVANYYTREEQAAITAKGVVQALYTAGFTDAQIAALQTRQDFRVLLESIDTNSELGQRQFVALLDLQQAYAQTVPIMEEQSQSLIELIAAAPQVEMLQRIFESDQQYQERQNDAVTNMVSSLNNIQESMGSMSEAMWSVYDSGQNLAGIMYNGLIRVENAINTSSANMYIESRQAFMEAARAQEAANEAIRIARESAALYSQNAPTDYFASGGYMTGPALVGEHGPEIFDPRTNLITTAPATSNIFGGAEVAAEIRALRDEVAMMRSETRATAVNTSKIARLQDNWDVRGLTVRTDADQPLDTVTV